MSRTSTTLRRLGVPSLAAATMVAGIPAFLGTAQAAHVGSLTLTPESSSASVGTCRSFTATIAPSSGRTLDPSELIDVVISERVASGGQSLSFCTLAPGSDSDDTDNPATPVGGGNGTAVGTAGTTVRAEFVATANADGTQSVTFGVAATEAGTADIRAFYEPDTADNDVFDGTELNDTSVLTFSTGTAGTAQGTADRVESVDASPESNVVFLGEPATFTATLRNAAGDTLVGVTPDVVFNSGPNSRAITATPSDNDGVSTFSYTPTNTGTDTLTVFVDQTQGTASAPVAPNNALDGNEPQDTVQTVVSAAPEGNSIELDAGNAQSARADDDSTFQQPGANKTEVFTATVTRQNSSGQTVPSAGVVVRFTITAQQDGVETLQPVEATTDANGVATTTLTDTVGAAAERVEVTATVRGQVVTAADTADVTYRVAEGNNVATSVNLTPETATTEAGTFRSFTATVRNANGELVRGAEVTVTVTGVGRLANGNRQQTLTTATDGTVTFETTSNATETGQQTVTVNTVGTGTTATADAREDSSVNTIVAAGATPAPTNTPGTPAPGATATPTVPLTIDVEDDTIVPTEQGVITVTGTPNAVVELFAYSRPSIEYREVRQGQLGEDGRIVFRILPGTNTRLYASYEGRTANDALTSRSVVQNVATALSLSVVRNGSLDYTFQGRILPRRAGQLITLYRVTDDGDEIITSQVRTDNTGTWRIRRVFTGQGTFGFLARTGQNLTNVAGVSNEGVARPTAIYAGPQR